MGVEIRIRGGDLTEAIRLHVEHKLQMGLQRFTGRVGRVQVMLTDLNGPRGGMDKSCRITAEVLPSHKVVTREARDSNLFAAITTATQKIRQEFRCDQFRVRRLGAERNSIRTETAVEHEHDEIMAASATVLLPAELPNGESG